VLCWIPKRVKGQHTWQGKILVNNVSDKGFVKIYEEQKIFLHLNNKEISNQISQYSSLAILNSSLKFPHYIKHKLSHITQKFRS
jgi:hypothetical protein